MSQSFFETASKNEWEGKGELLGSTASFRMNWEPILEGKFFRLSFQNQRDQSKEYIFRAMGVYQPNSDDTFTGTWFDSGGFSFPIKGSFSENELVVYWGTPETEEGKTIYTINEGGSVSVRDYVLKDGKLIQFGKASYEKQ
ncbi:hypothetical protein GCM10022258_21880 [Aquimarina gracilis]